jgi:ABC-2 type transport system ATP-binding protein
VLLLDEPLSGLDPAGRKEVLDLIEHLRGQCTVFMSTHILANIERVCDTIAIIAHGRLVTQAPREALLAQHAIPTFEVETDSDFKAVLNGWAESLRQKNWVQSVSISELKGRVIVHDIETAKRELLPSAIQAGLVLTRYEMVRPSLEDVFLRLVGEGRKA